MATREIYWNITGHWVLYPLLVAAVASFAFGFYRRWRLWRQGRPGSRQLRFWAGIRDVITLGLAQKRVLSEVYPGIMHGLIFWGTLVLLFATAVVAVQADLGVAAFRGGLYLFIKVTANLFGLLILLGIGMAAWRRYILRPTRLDNKPDDAVTLSAIAVVVLTGFVIEGVRMAAIPDPWAQWGFVGHWLAGPLDAAVGPSGLLVLHQALWWFHLCLALGLVAYLPYSKLFHVLLAPANQFMRPRGPVGVASMVDFEDEAIESYGISKLSELPRKTLYDADVCLRCGRCQDRCPATTSGKHLNPKNGIQDLRVHMEESERSVSGPRRDADGGTLIGDVVLEKDIWSCTTCRSCEAACPVLVEHVDKTVEMRRYLVLMESRFPQETRLVFDNLEVNGNPLGESALTRGDLSRRLGVPTIGENPDAEILFWAGCTGAFDARNQKATTAFVRLAESAGVSLATLGNKEKCCGDPARRLGNEYLFQSLARENIEELGGHGLRKIVTTCPHCFHTLKHEYPQLGGEYEVLHHTEFLVQLLSSGRLRLGRQARQIVTYHDSCYLGRYDGLFREPRALLKAAGLDVVEMPRRRAKAFCCGGGGGRVWLEEDEGERINLIRTDEVLSVSPDIAAVACPYCLTMLKDGVDARQAGDRVLVMDIAEILQLGLQ